ncbi:flagellar hook-length control protein FliK [Sporolactobacillus terrae]|uniref:Flagellar hook-length control protein FliK n=1 Tax=Sporolactobacillus terrae TaxID=269673 RepID=A0ABX5Q6S8_9BACL|nr:flagellar hook-length control protein FliK [Sporolactobacillus terrae]QAA22344.1 flagellar hook-length control protein FliK [Sporolactobacillus terrae]QAA25320.1 flagellar hook-length control protein FliK [Sporolactobacillus terrae]UAK17130.1 flagellar hook-length control protein FliK [Sporolactobacillus terrae]
MNVTGLKRGKAIAEFADRPAKKKKKASAADSVFLSFIQVMQANEKPNRRAHAFDSEQKSGFKKHTVTSRVVAKANEQGIGLSKDLQISDATRKRTTIPVTDQLSDRSTDSMKRRNNFNESANVNKTDDQASAQSKSQSAAAMDQTNRMAKQIFSVDQKLNKDDRPEPSKPSAFTHKADQLPANLLRISERQLSQLKASDERPAINRFKPKQMAANADVSKVRPNAEETDLFQRVNRGPSVGESLRNAKTSRAATDRLLAKDHFNSETEKQKKDVQDTRSTLSVDQTWIGSRKMNKLELLHLFQNHPHQSAEKPVHEQVADHLNEWLGKSSFKTDESGMKSYTMTLYPQHLGKLTVSIRQDKQLGLTAEFTAETQQAKALLEGDLGKLKHQCLAHGISLTRVEIHRLDQQAVDQLYNQDQSNNESGQQDDHRQNQSEDEQQQHLQSINSNSEKNEHSFNEWMTGERI